jgi:antitoxin PrlF
MCSPFAITLNALLRNAQQDQVLRFRCANFKVKVGECIYSKNVLSKIKAIFKGWVMNFHRKGTSSATKVIRGGRLQLPVEVRKQLGLSDGDSVILEIVGNELRVRSQREGIRRIQERLREFVPAGVSLSDELIADRRREAENE